MDFHLQKIGKSAESIQTMRFRHPGIFTNAVILKPEITTLIQDADAHEQWLFRTAGRAGQHIRAPPAVSSKLDVSGDISVDALCSAAEQLAALYPLDGLESRVSYYRSKAESLNESIFKNEEIVEAQRQQLQQLNSTIGGRDVTATPAEQDSASIEQAKQKLRHEVGELERQLERRRREVQQLERQLA